MKRAPSTALSVLRIDAARPVTPQGVFERFRLSDPSIRAAEDVFKELMDPRHRFRIGGLPRKVILPRQGRKNPIHDSKSMARTTPLPLSTAWMASSKRVAMRGLRSRCAVSSRAS